MRSELLNLFASLRSSIRQFHSETFTPTISRPRTLSEFTSRLGFENNWHHETIYGILESHELRALIVAPVRHAKTQCVSINWPLKLIGDNPDVRIGLVSNTATQAENILREISQHITVNPRYREMYPWVQPDPEKWTDSEILVRRSRIAKDPTIAAMGVTGPIIGRRWDVLICDDILDEENTSTPLQIARVETEFKKVILPRLEPWGRAVVVGTRWAVGDLYGQLEKEGWFTFTLKAIQDNGLALWVEQFPLDKLLEKRRELGEVYFNCLYQNDPVGLEGRLFKRDWLRYHEVSSTKDLWVVQAVDLAIGEKPESNYTVILTLGVTPSKELLVLGYVREKLDFPSQTRLILEEMERWGSAKTGIESIGFQKAQFQQIFQSGVVPVVEIKHGVKSKVDRIYHTLSPHLESGRLKIRKEMRELIGELMAFPHGETDDVIDALEMAVTLAAGLDQSRPISRSFG